MVNIILPLCCEAEQIEIIKIIDQITSELDKTEEVIEKQLIRAETLRQSILKKAFSGQLVEQDPNDEPASILLERIRAEKAKHSPKRSGRRKTRKAASA